MKSSWVSRLMVGDALEKLDLLEPGSVDCVFTSPDPPFHNDVGVGASQTFKEYYTTMMAIFKKVWRVLKDTGTLFLQVGDYHDADGRLVLNPYVFMMSMVSDGWIPRSDLIWHRPEESPQEDYTRFRRDTEHVFFFTKSKKHYFNTNSVYCETSLFTFPVRPRKENEFISGFPEGLIEVCLHTGCPPGGTVLDPFCDSGVTGVVALKMGMKFVGIELVPDKIPKIQRRLRSVQLDRNTAASGY